MNGNWIKKFNELERSKQEEILELICNLETFRSETLNDIAVEIYTLSQKADNVEIFELDLIKMMDRIDYLHHTYNNMILKYNAKIDLIDLEVNNLIDKVNIIMEDMTHHALSYVEGNASKYSFTVNGKMVRNRAFLFRKRIMATLNEFLEYDSGLDSEIDYARDTINILKKQALRRVDKEYKALEEKIKESKNTKIFNYKEMNKLAKLKGYVADRFSGDHLILVHKESNKGIVVPQHSLGKGISFKIQKQMKSNSI